MTKKLTPISPCPCGSNNAYQSCCWRYIYDNIPAPTPEALMRSRYTAYTQAKIGYIEATMRGEALKDFDRVSAKRWAKACEWERLEVLHSAERGDTGQVEFCAYYQLEGKPNTLHENSVFKREAGRWYYVGT